MDDKGKISWSRKTHPKSNNINYQRNNYVFTDDVKEKKYINSLLCRELFSEEQKGCHKGTKERYDQLYIVQHSQRKVKKKSENDATMWIYYKMNYDMVLQTWIIEFLKMFETSVNDINFIRKAMEN